jgi:hypothetical protein
MHGPERFSLGVWLCHPKSGPSADRGVARPYLEELALQSTWLDVASWNITASIGRLE